MTFTPSSINAQMYLVISYVKMSQHTTLIDRLFPLLSQIFLLISRGSERVRYTFQSKVRATYEENELHIWSEPRRKKPTRSVHTMLRDLEIGLIVWNTPYPLTRTKLYSC